jgi:LmbE family N-acetylglucosaminyl deacetylase
MSDTFQHVYLAPHYDDAVLSCGGLIHQQRRAGQLALVVTVFAAPPDSNALLSSFAQSQHRQWGSPANAVAARQAEDQAALQILGADYLRLKFMDCIYRGSPQQEEWYYLSEADLFGQVHPAEQFLVAEIVAAILELIPAEPGTFLYTPLALGNHVDHQLVMAAALQLRDYGYGLVFYEDYPYADPHYAPKYRHTDPVARVAQQSLSLQAQLCRLTEADVAAKIAAIAAYASQLPTLFGSEADMAERVHNFAWHVGQDEPAERTWVLA